MTVAGTNVYEPGGTYALPEGVAATTRPVTAWSLTVGADGALYIGGLSRIYKVDVDRTIHTVAGGGTNTAFVDGTSAFTAKLGTVYSVAVAPDGTIYYANDTIVGRITPDGSIYRVPGTFRHPHGVAVASDGTLLVADSGALKVGGGGAGRRQGVSCVGRCFRPVWSLLDSC